MLSEIRLRNFKGFGEETQTAPLGRKLTLIYGPNSGGKSSIIQALLMMKQSLKSRYVVARGEIVDLASFKNVINQRDTDKTVELGFTFEPNHYNITWDKDVNHELNTWDIEEEVWNKSAINVLFRLINKNSKGICKETFLQMSKLNNNIYNINNYNCHKKRRDEWYDKFFCVLYPPEYYDKANSEYYITNNTLNSFKDLTGLSKRYISQNIDQLKSYLIDDKINGFLPTEPYKNMLLSNRNGFENIENVIIKSSNIIRNNFNNIHYLEPLRLAPLRYYENTCHYKREGLRKNGADAILVLYTNTLNYVQDKKDEIGLTINPMLEISIILKALGINYNVSIDRVNDEISDVTGNLLCITFEKNGVKLSPRDIGFGISQLMPIIIQGIIAKNSIIIVEQPELHIHPLLVANLAEFFIYNANRNNNQWIIETHNPNIVYRIERLIKEGSYIAMNMNNEDRINIDNHKIQSTDINVLYVNDVQASISEYTSDGTFDHDKYSTLATKSIITYLGFENNTIKDFPEHFIDINDVVIKHSTKNKINIDIKGKEE